MRRRELLRAHPEIRELLGPEPRTAWSSALAWAVQMGAAALTAQVPVWAMVLPAYCVGAVAALAMAPSRPASPGCALLLRFLTDPAITLESRVVRPAKAPREVRPA